MIRRVRFQSGDASASYGIFDGDTVYQTTSLFDAARGTAHSLTAVKLLAPCLPSKIVCVGRNYREHAQEFNNPLPAEPLIFLKPPSSLIGPGDAIVHPAISERVDFEGELGIVIGRRARFISAADADDVIFGYTCVNDVTARDLQRKDGQWTRGKGFDTFCPVGPWIVPREHAVFGSMRVRTLVNEKIRQDAPVIDMIFNPGAIIEYVTRFMTLEPGDLIATGTPSGVGPLAPGEVVRVEVEGIGALENVVVKEERS